VARHVTTLAAMISGIVGSTRTQLPHIATKVPDSTQAESRIKRFARWVRNDKITPEVSFVPYAKVLLAHLALQTLVLVIDGSVVGRGCVALMIHVVYKGRALPLAWLVRQGQKGHLPEDVHIALVEQVDALLPASAQVVLLGDGECDGTDLQHTLEEAGWSYVCRTGCHMTASWEDTTLRLESLGACIKPGTLIALQEVLCTGDAYGPIMVLCCWAKGYQEPLYLISTMASSEEACRLYSKRFRIETFFSDQKSRGCHLHQSHLSDPRRLSRWLMAAGFASIWVVSLGARGVQDGWINLIHRGDRCDRSLFQLGLRRLDDVLHEGFTIPVAFYITM